MLFKSQQLRIVLMKYIYNAHRKTKNQKTKAYKMKMCKQRAWNESTKWGEKRKKDHL